MNTKLTLNLDKHIIESAKYYAKNNKVSLSQLIENYLNSIVAKKKKNSKVSPLVKSLTGVIPGKAANTSNKDYYDYLNKKYS